MKTSIHFLISILILSLYVQGWSQDKPALCLTTSLNAKEASQVIFEPTGELEISFWNDDIIQLTVEIYNTDIRREQLKGLVPLGIFRSKTILENNCLILTMPGVEKETIFNGNNIVWNIRYFLKIPHSIKVVRKSAGFVAQ